MSVVGNDSPQKDSSVNKLILSAPITRRRALAALTGGGVLLLASCGGGNVKLTGSDLGEKPAPDFTLTDQRGEKVTLSAYHGKAVVLTFLYTNCPSTCPITAQALHTTNGLLSSKVREKVELLAVTVDPTHDTDAAMQQFSEVHGLASSPNWHFMNGTEAQLKPIWSAYYIDPGNLVMSPQSHGAPPALAHTDAVYVIDTKGRERVLLHSDLDPKKLASDLKTLVE